MREAPLIARVHVCDRTVADRSADSREPRDSNRMIDPIARPLASATEFDHRDADGTRVDRLNDAGLLRIDRPNNRRSRKVLLRPFDEVGRAAQRRDHSRELLGGPA